LTKTTGLAVLKKLFTFSGFKLGLLITIVFCATKLPICGLVDSQALKFLNNIENTWLDNKFRIRGGPKSEADKEEFQRKAHVVIAAVDEKSMRHPDLGMWPWPRSKTAILIQKLNECGAKVIGFDVVYSEPDSSRAAPLVKQIIESYAKVAEKDDQFIKELDEIHTSVHGDQILANVLEEYENVVLGYFFFVSEEEVRKLDEDDLKAGKDSIGFGTISYSAKCKECEWPEMHKSFTKALGVRANLPILSEAAEIYGYFNQMPDPDRIYRHIPMVFSYDEKFFPSLSLQVLSLYYQQPIELFVNTMTGDEFIAGHVGLFIGPLELPGENHINIPVHRGAMFRVNYYGPKRTFRHVSAGDIIHGEKQACAAVKDKVVLVGATAIGIYDHRAMPFEPDFPGVEIHATAIENIITENFMLRHHLFFVLEGLFILVFGILLSWFLTRFRLTIGAIVTLFILAGIAFVDYFFFFLSGLQVHVVIPIIHVAVLFAGIAVYRYATEEREKSKIRHAFQFYLSGDVIDDVLHDTSKLALGGERRELTVLFSDIRGFTTISEQLPPEELIELLNEYLTPMTDIVFRHHGTLDKYIGDAVMALFGAPVPFEDHPQAACRTALEMMEELARLREGWAERGLPEMDIGIGINTGPMSVGNMGSATRFDYTVVGDNVNLGARLEGLNKNYGTHIIISQYTMEAVGGHFTSRELDAVQVKGKHEPVNIYELLHKGPPDPAKDAWLDDFHEALMLYKSQKWDAAIEAFSKLESDSVSRMYVKRSNEMKKNPPDPNWDGVFKMTTK
jgi:adenylate cyclase